VVTTDLTYLSIPKSQIIKDEVYHGIKDPKIALDEAASKSAKTLGW
jgi:hypothetical protein